MERWTRFVLRHRWAVVGVWLTAFVVSGWVSQGLSDLLSNRFSIPGSETAKAEKILRDVFNQRSDGAYQLVFRAASGETTKEALPELEKAAGRAAAAVPSGELVSVEAVSDSVAAATVSTAFQPADAKPYTDDVRAAVGEIDGGTLYVTGTPAVTADLDPVFADDIKKGEFYIAIPIALLILLFVFGTLSVLLPLVFALVAIPTTLAIVWIFANFMELSTYLENMVMLIGLGIAVDYSLLIVYRFREERQAGGTRDEAILRTMTTAGRAVIFSGTAVAIGLALMLAMPLPFMRGFGLGGLVIPIVSVICALTLLPALLSLAGDRLERVRIVPAAILRRREDEGNMWARLARAIMRRPLPFALASSAALIALALPVLALEVGPGTNKGIPQNLPSVQGLNVLSDAVGAGALSPTEVVVDTKRPGGLADPEVREGLDRLFAAIREDPEAAAVVGGLEPPWADPTRRYLHFQVPTVHEYGTPEAMNFARRLRSEIILSARLPAGVEVLAGGGPPSSVDVIETSYDAFPWLVLAVLVATYFLLLRAFRSLLLPLKAIVLNLLSIGAAYGLLVIVFKWGAGSAIGLESYDQIEFWIPIFLFAMLFGLSMDYEVFLVSRMREEWDKTHDNERAVALGLAKTGRIVTAAGLIMFAAFMGFVAGSILGLQQFGFGLAAAIIMDVTIIRALLVPSAMKLFGRWNWWLPPNVAKVFRVKPSPMEPRRRAPAGSLGR
jgi:RND superfamily putative drug exporter